MVTQAAPRVRAVTLGISPSFGFGDRIGLATPGHVAAMQRDGSGIQPIFVQQSIREMERTNRSPAQVLHDAIDGMTASAWDGLTGADADHLKSTADVDATHAAGYTFYTIDPSDHVDEHADSYDEATLRAKYQAVRDETEWVSRYQGRRVTCGATLVKFDETACIRCAVKYGRAIKHALLLGEHIRAVNEAAGTDYEIELSVDETEQPTTLAEHYIIAEICMRNGMKLVSLAPRYVGDFEKGVDYKGDVAVLERSLQQHAAIADALGPYKLSLHSGSDKLAMYPAFARASGGRFHVKTAGTSYLEAIRVVARHDQGLFRRIIGFARGRYDTDKATYHVSATVAGVPPAEAIRDPVELEHAYLELWERVPPGQGFTQPGRQILHCTFGSTLRDAELGPAIMAVLADHPDTYCEVLADHFARHLAALRAGLG